MRCASQRAGAAGSGIPALPKEDPTWSLLIRVYAYALKAPALAVVGPTHRRNIAVGAMEITPAGNVPHYHRPVMRLWLFWRLALRVSSAISLIVARGGRSTP